MTISLFIATTLAVACGVFLAVVALLCVNRWLP